MSTDKQQKQDQHISLQVVTTSGNYPEQGFHEFNPHQKLSTVLHQAARELKLKNTEAWQAKVGDRVLDPERTIAENGLTDNTRIQWAPVERGGGACTRR